MDMGMGVEVEDDLFFADLSKRISLLITEEEEEFPGNYPDLSFQGYYPHAPLPFLAPQPFLYEQGAAAAYRRETKGTGVFFPRSTMPKKKSRSGRSRQQGDKSATRSSATAAASAAASIIHHPSAAGTKKHQYAQTT